MHAPVNALLHGLMRLLLHVLVHVASRCLPMNSHLGTRHVSSVDDDDPEATYFREMHAKLHEAMFAVLQASDHEVRYFE